MVRERHITHSPAGAEGWVRGANCDTLNRVMPGFDPGIQAADFGARGLDCRDKPGNDRVIRVRRLEIRTSPAKAGVYCPHRC